MAQERRGIQRGEFSTYRQARRIWGCFHHTGVGVLKRVEGTIDAQAYKQILIHRAMPELKALIDKEPSHVAWLFQHDNASVHTAGVVTKYLE